jgi:hypothetical protein
MQYLDKNLGGKIGKGKWGWEITWLGVDDDLIY